MNQEDATKLLEDANKRIKNALDTCVTLSAELTQERKRTEEQAYQLDFLNCVLMHIMARHRYEFMNIERSKLAEVAKSYEVYFEISQQSQYVFVEKRLRAVPFSEVKEQCATATPGNTGETQSDSIEKPESTTSHYEHNPNSEATALPS